MSDTNNIVVFNGSYDELMNKMKEYSKLCVIDFFGTWCGPCKRLSALLPNIAQEFPEVTFLKVDIDKNEEITNKYEILIIPHLKYFKITPEKEIIEIGNVQGANIYEIQDKIKECLQK